MRLISKKEDEHLKQCKRDLFRILGRSDDGTVESVIAILEKRQERQTQILNYMATHLGEPPICIGCIEKELERLHG